MNQQLRPSAAFVGAAWAVLLAGSVSYLIGLWNSELQLNEKGYYFTLLLFGLFGAISLQKTVRDRLEGFPVTNMYYMLCWVAVGASVILMAIGLFNATMAMSEKGFFAMAFLVSGFAAITVQKNVRDISILGPSENEHSQSE